MSFLWRGRLSDFHKEQNNTSLFETGLKRTIGSQKKLFQAILNRKDI